MNTFGFVIRGMFSVSLFFLLLCCSGSQAMFEKGQKLEKAQLYKEASTFYLDAIRRDNDNIEAKIALSRVANLVVDKYIEDIKNQYRLKKNKDLVYLYIEAREYLDELKKANLDLSMDAESTSYFEDAKVKYSNDLLVKGKTYLDEENFTMAAKIFSEVVEIYPENDKARNNLKIATDEPIYRDGVSSMNDKQYRKAYYKFSRIEDFKNSKNLKQLCLEKGSLWVYIGTFDKSGFISMNIDVIIKSNVTKRLKNYDDPFLNLYDQVSNSKPIYGTKVVLNARVNRVDKKQSPLYQNVRKGWDRVRFVYQDINGQDSIVYKYNKVYYYEYKSTKTINVEVSFAMNSHDSNNLVFEDLVNKKAQDNIRYIEYAGDIDNLFPGNWQYANQDSPIDYISKSYGDIRSVRALYSGRRYFASDNDLSKGILNSISKVIVKKVIEYNESLEL